MVEHSQQSVHLGGIARAVCCYVPTLHARVALLLLDLCTYIHTYIHLAESIVGLVDVRIYIHCSS